jgi:hypothetical protein
LVSWYNQSRSRFNFGFYGLGLWCLTPLYWILYYLCNQCLSPLTLWVQIPPRRGVLDTILCDKKIGKRRWWNCFDVLSLIWCVSWLFHVMSWAVWLLFSQMYIIIDVIFGYKQIYMGNIRFCLIICSVRSMIYEY